MDRHTITNQSTMREAQGFSLLELIVVVVIVGIASVWAIPDVRRGIVQAKVDRYTSNVESGLFNFRARMGATKESCTIDFSNISSFNTTDFHDAPLLLEQKPTVSSTNNTRDTSDPLYRCNYTSGDFNDMISDSSELTSQSEAEARMDQVAAAVRLVNLLGSEESRNMEVRALSTTYSFTPPGTSINANSMTLLIRSKETGQDWSKKDDGTSRLVTRCIEVSGNGQVFSGKWNGSACIGN